MIDSLKGNEKFELTILAKDGSVIGGKRVYAVKEPAENGKTIKARYVARGHNQIEEIDYHETFAPTENVTSVRALMQIPVQNDLIVHQMDVKTAYFKHQYMKRSS